MFNNMVVSDKISLIAVAISIVFGISSFIVSITALKRTDKQQKLDEYKLKINIYSCINLVFEYCDHLKRYDNWLIFLDYPVNGVKEINDNLIKQMNLNEREISESLNNAKHLYKNEIVTDIEEIRSKFLITINCFKALDIDENHKLFNINALETALDNIKYICGQKEKIISELDENIKIV